MKTTVLLVWLCWWIGQCLCNQYLPLPHEPNPNTHTWRPSLSHNTSVRKRILIKKNLHPAPGVTEATHYNTENTSHTVLTTSMTNKVNYGTPENNLREHKAFPSTHTEVSIHSAGKNFSTVDDSAIDKKNQEDLPKAPNSDPENHTESSLLSKPAHDNKPLDMADKLSTPQTFTEAGKSEGGKREGHGRVITGLKDLCSSCLCNVEKKDVFCKPEHTNDNRRNLNLDHQVIPLSAETLHIAGFEKVHVKNNTFSQANLKLRNIHFEDIAHLELLTNSLHFSAQANENMEVAVIFTNCNISEMPQQTFTQLTRSKDPKLDLNLEKTRFLTLKFDGCNITTMRTYALYNARVLYFHMIRTKVEVMEDHCVHIDSYVEWIIEESQLPNMKPKSICLRAQNIVAFSHNTILGLGKRSLDILSSSQVLFEFNQVSHLESEALLGIRPHKEARAANIVFLNNTIVNADENSLLTSKQYPNHERKIIDNKFNIPCNCSVMKTFEKLLGITNTSDYSDLAIFKAVTKKSLCKVSDTARLYTKIEGYVSKNCTLPITVIVAGTAVAVVILILVIVCMVSTWRVQKAREEANYLGECHISQSFSTLHSNSQFHMSSMSGHPGQSWEPTSPLQPWVMAVPEVKTYQELELNVAYEHTEPIKVSLRDSFPHEPGPLLDLQYKTKMRSSCPFN